jgi:hypothetical protein
MGAYSWPAALPETQLDMDPTMVPVGRGAIFVPTMSNPELEPPFRVYVDDQYIGNSRCGTRFIVPAGDYVVELGSGASTDRIRRQVHVAEGRTALVPADWSGLQIRVVDENGIPHRGVYELIAMPQANNLGIGYGANIERGEVVRNWILEPGTYLIIKVGDTFQARTNFFTVRLVPGTFDTINLVMNRDTGDFLGAGQVFGGGGRLAGIKDLQLTATLGGGLDFSRQTNVVGTSDNTLFTPSLYADAVGQWLPGRNLVYGQFTLDEVFTQRDGKRLEKTADDVQLYLLYSYKVTKRMGPYVRAGIRTTLFPGYVYFSKKQTVVEVDQSGNVLHTWKHRDRFQTSDPFFPMTLLGGVGLRMDTPPSTGFNAWALLGMGGRKKLAGGTLTSASSPDGWVGRVSPTALRRAIDEDQFGAELTIVAQGSLLRFFNYTAQFEYFPPFNNLDDPDLRLDTNLGLRLTSYVSLNYSYRMLRDPKYSEFLQHDHRATVRFSYTFF